MSEKQIDDIEAYARGLALAEGTDNHGGLTITMAVEAESALRVLARRHDCKNGLRGPHVFPSMKPGYSPLYRIHFQGKAWWKKSTAGIEGNLHAIRGYLEGDGCISERRIRAGLRPQVQIFVVETEGYILNWLLAFLREHEIKNYTALQPPWKENGAAVWRIFIAIHEIPRFLRLLYPPGALSFRRERVELIIARFAEVQARIQEARRARGRSCSTPRGYSGRYAKRGGTDAGQV